MVKNCNNSIKVELTYTYMENSWRKQMYFKIQIIDLYGFVAKRRRVFNKKTNLQNRKTVI